MCMHMFSHIKTDTHNKELHIFSTSPTKSHIEKAEPRISDLLKRGWEVNIGVGL
jgi:hypothetical protein